MTDEESSVRYTEEKLLLTGLGDRVLTALAAVLSSSYGEDMAAYINDEDVVKDAEEHTAMAQELVELKEQESKLVQDYYTLSDSDSAAPEDFEQLYLDLLDNRIAQVQYLDGDYTSYADYCYAEGFCRDYTPEDLEVFRQWVKDFVPVYLGIIAYKLRSDSDSLHAYSTLSLSQDEIVERVHPWVCTVDSEAAEIFRKMLDYNLLDIEASDVKASLGFTTALNAYGMPFIFNCPGGNASDIETLIHEFGHYFEESVNMRPSIYKYDCIDTCEIDSQGLEVLLLEDASDIYGEYLGYTATLYTIYQKLIVIVDGCVFDEFQQEAFAAREAGTLTSPEQVTELFVSIENSYYGQDMWGEEWYRVGHTFESPFYYISYATSASAALSLLVVAEQDRAVGIETYNQLVRMGNEQGFVNTLEVLGLPNPLTEYGDSQLTEGLGEYFEGLLGAVIPAA